ncbi:MAG TPA: hypothetical protein VK675_00125 [Candidatus Paceibacterota bacterium]|nr:hypothetical protein [Candidatus Paceibacterota bacterium]
MKFFKKEKKFKKRSLHLSPNLFWKLAVWVMFMTAVFSAIFGYYLVLQINKEFIVPEATSSGQVEIVKKERIDKVLVNFSLRKTLSDQILKSPAPIVDPSL